MAIRDKALELAKGQVGVAEQPKGSNWGPKVSEFIRSAGYDDPVYWCLCFQFWAVQEAAKATGEKNPLPKTGSCDLLLEWAKRGDHLTNSPAPGDLFLIMASANDAIHVGMVTGVDGNTITTVEGNSNNDGSNNGYAVVNHKRNIAKLKFIRWARANQSYALIIGGKKVVDMPVVDGTSYAPIRPIITALGLDQDQVHWDAETQGVRYSQDLFHGTAQLKDGVAFLPIRAVAGFFGLDLKVDDEKNTVTMFRP